MTKFMVIVLACALALGGHASADPAHTRAELQALPPAEAEQVAKSDLSSLLKPETGFKTGLLAHQLKGVSFVTPAYGTDFEGLCRRDSLALSYTPTTMEGKPEDRPLKPYAVRTTAWFADIGMADAPGNTHLILTPACQALDGKADVDWFPAQDPWQAAEVVLLLRKVRAQLTAGQPALPSCDSKCKAAVLASSHIFRIGDCAAPTAETEGEICYDIWTDSSVAIHVKAKKGTALPGDIESITAGTNIVFVD